MTPKRSPALAAGLILLAVGVPISARPYGAYGGYGGFGWAAPFDRGWSNDRATGEGKASASAFVAPGAAGAALGHGPIAVHWSRDNLAVGSESGAYQQAVASRLATKGYAPDPRVGGGQSIDVTVSHAQVAPAEPRRAPIYGEMAVGGGNRGAGTAIALGIDLSKPRGALIETRLAAHIDDASGQRLWEGTAVIATREGDRRWTNERLADVLTAALFRKFPQPA